MTKKLNITFRTGQTEIHVTNGDLTQVKADVLVSSDDVYLLRRDGIARALSSKAGIALDNDIRKLTVPLELGTVAVTNAGRLPAHYLFHATTMDFATDPPMRDLVAHLTRRIMELGAALDVDHIAMPLLGTGNAGFLPAQGLDSIFQTVAYHATSNKYPGIKKISIIVFGSPPIQTVVKDIKKKIADAEVIQDKISRYQHIIIEEAQDEDDLEKILSNRIGKARTELRDVFFFEGVKSSDDFGKKDNLLTHEGYLEAKKRLTETREKLANQISSKQDLLKHHKKRLGLLKEEQAMKGFDTPSHVKMEIEDIEEQIGATQYELEQIAEQQTMYQQEFDSLQYQ